MKTFLLVAGLLVAGSVMAQDKTIKELKAASERTIAKDANDTTQKTWKTGGAVGLNVTQGSLSNWAAGGDKFSLALNSNLNLFAFYKKGKHNWDNTLDLNLAYMNTTTLGNRKNDDRIDLLSRYGYALNKKWQVGGLFNFRSQMFKGYTYDSENNRTFTSNFMSPAYVVVSPGITYTPSKSFSAFISPATVRWTIVANDSLSDAGLYGVDPGKKLRTEFGGFASLNYFKEFTKNISYKSRLDLYSNYLSAPKNVDVFFTNVINIKLSKLFAINYNFDLIYDDDVKLFGPNQDAPRTQIRSMLGIGLSYKF